MEDAKLIETRELVKRFPMGDQPVVALNKVNLTFRKGEFTGLVGPSGSGKTTLLNIIGSLDLPTEGHVSVMGEAMETLSHKQAARFRNQYVGFIFQMFNLLPVYTVYENVEFPLLLQHMPSRQRHEAVHQALTWVGLANRSDSRPSQLSGGESQRVAIARAMVKKPVIVLADEPTANLDADNSHHILQTMQRLNQELQTTFIFATHDDKVIHYLGRKISLDDGKVVNDQVQTSGVDLV